jgi:hypothetical protein
MAAAIVGRRRKEVYMLGDDTVFQFKRLEISDGVINFFLKVPLIMSPTIVYYDICTSFELLGLTEVSVSRIMMSPDKWKQGTALLIRMRINQGH